MVSVEDAEPYYPMRQREALAMAETTANPAAGNIHTGVIARSTLSVWRSRGSGRDDQLGARMRVGRQAIRAPTSGRTGRPHSYRCAPFLRPEHDAIAARSPSASRHMKHKKRSPRSYGRPPSWRLHPHGSGERYPFATQSGESNFTEPEAVSVVHSARKIKPKSRRNRLSPIAECGIRSGF
jgi:hypothetical protein